MQVLIDTSGLKDLAKALRKAAPELSKEFGASLRAGGLLVAEDAKHRANAFPGKHRTGRIASSIKVRRSGVTVKVLAGGGDAPEGAPIEHGGQPGTFRHPVFRTAANPDTWAPQPAHPYLHPAAEAAETQILTLVLAGVDQAFRNAGWS